MIRYLRVSVLVVAVDADRGVANVVGSGKNITIGLDRDRHWEHAYASTVHAAQGQTVDRVLVHLDTKYERIMASESFYVAISRARQEARLYVNDESGVAVSLGRSLQRPYALEALTSARSSVQLDRSRTSEAGVRTRTGRSLHENYDSIPHSLRLGSRSPLSR